MKLQHSFLICLASFVAMGSIACSKQQKTPEQTGASFLLFLQQQDFTAAAELATTDTAGIVLFIEKMIDASETTGQFLELPIPGKDAVELRTSEQRDGYRYIEFTSGEELFILHALETDEGWKIRLPRNQW